MGIAFPLLKYLFWIILKIFIIIYRILFVLIIFSCLEYYSRKKGHKCFKSSNQFPWVSWQESLWTELWLNGVWNDRYIMKSCLKSQYSFLVVNGLNAIKCRLGGVFVRGAGVHRRARLFCVNICNVMFVSIFILQMNNLLSTSGSTPSAHLVRFHKQMHNFMSIHVRKTFYQNQL